jgi:FkbM family methyltransferase
MHDDIKQVGGVWLPAHETHMTEWMKKRNAYVDGRLTYQYHKLQAAMPHTRQRRVAVDVGAHVGFWSMHLAKWFNVLHAFEPMSLHRKCWEMNMAAVADEGRRKAVCNLHPVALGDRPGHAVMHTTQGSSGDTWVDPAADAAQHADAVPVATLDSMELRDVDFLKIDCEGFELFVLKGGIETLLRDRPCVVVEQKVRKDAFAQRYGLGNTDAVVLLQSLGAKVRQVWSGDYIMSWDA